MNQTKGLKLLAFVISVILWAYVRVTVGGVTHNSITQLDIRIPLELKGAGSNLIPFERSTDTVKLTLRGDSEVVTKLREGLVRAYVDLQNVSAGSAWPEVQVLVPPGVQILNKDPASVNVRLSPRMVKEVPLKLETAGKPKVGYQVGFPLYDTKRVKLEGPEELVTQVAIVSGVVQVDGFDKPVSLTVKNLVPVNDNGTAVMGTDSSIRLDVREVSVTIPVEEKQSVANLPVLTEDVKVINQEGYSYTLDYEPHFVQVSTRLSEDQMPKGIQASPVTLKPKGLSQEQIEVELVAVDGLTFLGASKVTIKVTPKKVKEDDDKNPE